MKVKFYSYPEYTVTVKTKPAKKRLKAQEPSFKACGETITRSQILRSKWLDCKEKQMLLDLCKGVTVVKQKRTDKKGSKRIVGRYVVDGKIFRDGSISEDSYFWGI